MDTVLDQDLRKAYAPTITLTMAAVLATGAALVASLFFLLADARAGLLIGALPLIGFVWSLRAWLVARRMPIARIARERSSDIARVWIEVRGRSRQSGRHLSILLADGSRHAVRIGSLDPQTQDDVVARLHALAPQAKQVAPEWASSQVEAIAADASLTSDQRVERLAAELLRKRG